MAEAKKRFPWWLAICAVVLVLLAAVVGFVETVGQRGTLLGRYERIQNGVPQEDLVAMLGPDLLRPDGDLIPRTRRMVWEEGPVRVTVLFESNAERSARVVCSKWIAVRRSGFLPWRTCRWAEQAYAAIHGPRR